jgi:uncharacterized protein
VARAARAAPTVPPELRPLPGRPILWVGGGVEPHIVVADLHLGLGYSDVRGPRPDRGTAEALAAELIAVAQELSARRLLVVGDVKEPIRGTPRHVRAEVREFFGRLEEAGVSCEVVLGNHDVGLASMLPPGVRLHPAGGLLRDGVGYFHGHAWPSRTLLLRARTLVCGHLHPGYRLAPSTERTATGKEPCWVRAELRPLTPRERRSKRKHPPPRAASFLVLPAFNPLCANEALNRTAPARGRRFLVRRFLSRGSARAYLLDGTDVGTLHWSGGTGLSSPTNRRRPRSGAPSRAPSPR